MAGDPSSLRFPNLRLTLLGFCRHKTSKPESGISHHGQAVQEEEELTLKLENYAVLTGLKLIHDDLPKLLKQRYGTELRSRTLVFIRPEIFRPFTHYLGNFNLLKMLK